MKIRLGVTPVLTTVWRPLTRRVLADGELAGDETYHDKLFSLSRIHWCRQVKLQSTAQPTAAHMAVRRISGESRTINGGGSSDRTGSYMLLLLSCACSRGQSGS
jgi:hypothetical protein